MPLEMSVQTFFDDKHKHYECHKLQSCVTMDKVCLPKSLIESY